MKLTTMIPCARRAWAMTLLASMIIANVVTWPARAQVGDGDANGLVGPWNVTINVTSPPGFPSFPVLMTFHADGTMLQSRPSYIPAFGVLETPASGRWTRIRGNQIAATTIALVQGSPGNTTLNGAFYGTERVSFRPVISANGNSFAGQRTNTVYDQNGNPILQGSGTMAAVRIQVD